MFSILLCNRYAYLQTGKQQIVLDFLITQWTICPGVISLAVNPIKDLQFWPELIYGDFYISRVPLRKMRFVSRFHLK